MVLIWYVIKNSFWLIYTFPNMDILIISAPNNSLVQATQVHSEQLELKHSTQDCRASYKAS